MTTSEVTKILGWCIVLNFALLLWWVLWMILAHEWVYQLQSLVVDISIQQMNVIHYGAMAFYKILIIVFNVIPYLAMKVVHKNNS
jgi:hypothetical protein